MNIKPVAIVAILAVFGLIVAAALFLTGSDAMERLGLLIALASTILPVLFTALKSDVAATASTEAASTVAPVAAIASALNGGLEARIRHSVREVANETGTTADTARAQADAAVSTEPPAAGNTMGTPPSPPAP